MTLPLQLDLDLHAGGQLQAHQGLHGLGAGVGDVDQALMCTALELLPAILILVDGPQDGHDLLLGGQGDGAGDVGAGALCGLYDLVRGLVDDLVVVGFQTNADHFFSHCMFLHNLCTK